MRYFLNIALIGAVMFFNWFAKPVMAGAYRIISPSEGVTVTCQRKSDCTYKTVVIFANDTGRDLYNTTLYTSAPYEGLKYIGFDGNWTTGQSTSKRVVRPDESISVALQAHFPTQYPGNTYFARLNIDAQTCKMDGVTPFDCIFYGGKEFFVKFVVVSPTPTLVPTSTPIPISTSVPEPTPTLTPAPFPNSTSDLLLTPTLASSKNSSDVNSKENNVSGLIPTPLSAGNPALASVTPVNSRSNSASDFKNENENNNEKTVSLSSTVGNNRNTSGKSEEESSPVVKSTDQGGATVASAKVERTNYMQDKNGNKAVSKVESEEVSDKSLAFKSVNQSTEKGLKNIEVEKKINL